MSKKLFLLLSVCLPAFLYAPFFPGDEVAESFQLRKQACSVYRTTDSKVNTYTLVPHNKKDTKSVLKCSPEGVFTLTHYSGTMSLVEKTDQQFLSAVYAQLEAFKKKQ